jgi:hypothetical protein
MDELIVQFYKYNKYDVETLKILYDNLINHFKKVVE